jgi:hypothetical protein
MMRTTRIHRDIFDDEATPASERVMRAYWLAPRTSRSATILALHGGVPARRADRDDLPPSDLA